MRDMIWVCRDGRQWRVSDMETRHINNCVAMILRNRGWRREYLDRLLLELEIRAMGLTSKKGDAR